MARRWRDERGDSGWGKDQAANQQATVAEDAAAEGVGVQICRVDLGKMSGDREQSSTVGRPMLAALGPSIPAKARVTQSTSRCSIVVSRRFRLAVLSRSIASRGLPSADNTSALASTLTDRVHRTPQMS